MTINLSTYDYEILARVEEILRDDMPAIIAEINNELDNLFLNPPVMVIVNPEDAQLAAREDARIDERALPQNINGVWVRITGTEEVLGVGSTPGNGQSRSKHRLELTTFVRTQQYERNSFHPTVLTTGYKMVTLLARAATLALTRNLVCSAGVYNIVRVSGNRIPTPLKKYPYVHQVRDYFDVWQTTAR